MNYKIKVRNKEQADEAQELFFELGGSWAGYKKIHDWPEIKQLYLSENYITFSNDINFFVKDSGKEITLPELRALVSLHKNPINMDKVLSEVRSDALGLLKDKEYLNKETHVYVKTNNLVSKDSNWIEIPEGAIKATLCNDFLIFWKDDFLSLSVKNGDTDFTFEEDEDYGFVEYMDINDDAVIIWQCATHPEELPFVDDEPNQTTINAINEADTLFADADSSKHNHYFIDVSDVDEIDFYEIALRYNVTDPCIQHILKKCLAVGNRGHKDFHTDLKDIYDTAARALCIHGG